MQLDYKTYLTNMRESEVHTFKRLEKGRVADFIDEVLGSLPEEEGMSNKVQVYINSGMNTGLRRTNNSRGGKRAYVFSAIKKRFITTLTQLIDKQVVQESHNGLFIYMGNMPEEASASQNFRFSWYAKIQFQKPYKPYHHGLGVQNWMFDSPYVKFGIIANHQDGHNRFITTGAVPHHVDNSRCFGDFEAPMMRALTKGDVTSFQAIAQLALFDYNAESPLCKKIMGGIYHPLYHAQTSLEYYLSEDVLKRENLLPQFAFTRHINIITQGKQESKIQCRPNMIAHFHRYCTQHGIQKPEWFEVWERILKNSRPAYRNLLFHIIRYDMARADYLIHDINIHHNIGDEDSLANALLVAVFLVSVAIYHTKKTARSEMALIAQEMRHINKIVSYTKTEEWEHYDRYTIDNMYANINARIANIENRRKKIQMAIEQISQPRMVWASDLQDYTITSNEVSKDYYTSCLRAIKSWLRSLDRMGTYCTRVIHHAEERRKFFKAIRKKTHGDG